MTTASPTTAERELRIGLISDTHGLLRPQAIGFLQGCDHIVHGGDIAEPGVLERLAILAPVTAVRGNNDKGAWAQQLQETELFQLGGVWFYAIHDLSQIDIDPHAAGVQVVVSGHSHRPLSEARDGVLYVNPGSAGPRRFKLPISVAELRVRNGRVLSTRIVELGVEGEGGAEPRA
ncbi:MAG: metallophosphoesterase family protein [Pseudomonadota bacterium]